MSLSKIFLDRYGPHPLPISFFVQLKSFVERRIINASAEIRKDPDWAQYLDSEEKRQSWSDMCTEKFKATALDMVYIFKELKYYNILHENVPHGMVLGGADMVWFIDIPNNDGLALEFKQYATVLEAAYPKKRVDRSEGGCVLRLIDPLLYPLDYKLAHVLPNPIETPEQALSVKTFGDKPGSFEAWSDIVRGLNKRILAPQLLRGRGYVYRNFNRSPHVSYPICWLPTDIRVNVDGSVVIKSYINNLYPTKHSTFYETLSKALEVVVIPLVEQVLIDLMHPNESRVRVDDDKCVRFTIPSPRNGTYRWSDLNTTDDDDAWEDWKRGIVYFEPVPVHYVNHLRPLPLPPTYTLRGEELHLVVEMETTYLTPKNPYCSQGEWQTSGTPNDNIVATAIWYYDVENTKISSIRFCDLLRPYDKYFPTRGSIAESVYHYVYNIGGIDRMLGWFFNQAYGFTGIKGGRVVCFPSSYQYTEPEMNLADPSKPGHVKKLYFHFVHPGVRVPSTSIVPPQQQEWWAGTIFSIPPMDSIPVELQTMILKNVDMPMSLKRAYKKYDRERYNKLRADEKEYNYYTWAFVYWRSLQREGYIQ